MLYCSTPPPNMEYLAVWIKPARGGREHETRHPSLLGHGLLYNAILMKKLHDIPPSRIRPALCSISPPNMEYLAVWIKPARGGREHETRHPSLLGHGLLYNAILLKKITRHPSFPNKARPIYNTILLHPSTEHGVPCCLDQACKRREGT